MQADLSNMKRKVAIQCPSLPVPENVIILCKADERLIAPYAEPLQH